MNKLVLLFALLSAGCSAAIDLPTPTPTTTPKVWDATPLPSTTSSPIRELPQPPTPETCTVSTGVPAGYLNLRSGAGMQYRVIRVLNEGEVLTVNTRGEWHEVTDAQGNHGFINSNYCKG